MMTNAALSQLPPEPDMPDQKSIDLKKTWRVRQFWTIENLPWEQLDPSKVAPDLLSIIKAASLVEYNASVYAKYLCQVFHDDPDVIDDIEEWSKEEIQHGTALATWAERIDPNWNFEKAMKKFRRGYKPEHFVHEVSSSIRGSRSAEMVARCMVEIGTSSYYTAIRKTTDEPVLREICRLIAGDEFRHYKCFYDILQKYIDVDRLGKLSRLKVAISRISESEDDELAYAYYAANAGDFEPYNCEKYSKEYLSRAYSYYQKQEVDRAVSMIFKACGFKPQTPAYKIATHIAWWKFESVSRSMQKIAA